MTENKCPRNVFQIEPCANKGTLFKKTDMNKLPHIKSLVSVAGFEECLYNRKKLTINVNNK